LRLHVSRLSKRWLRRSTLSADALRELATLQAALTAVKEEIETHGTRMGWGDEDELK
jgi:hypothetical protein